MLVLTREVDQSIRIGHNIQITIVDVRGSGSDARVRLGITCPPEIPIDREEVYHAKLREQSAIEREQANAEALGGNPFA